MACLAALGLALTIPFLRELALPGFLTAAWAVLWLVIAWRAGVPEQGGRPRSTTIGVVLETGAIGMLLGLVLLTLLVAAVARQDMAPEDARRASYGVLLLGLGLLHLMIRRHARRAAIGFAALGLGLQVLDGAARGAQVLPASTAGGVLVSAWVATVLALRIADARERHAGSVWVTDAHDLHD